MNVLIREAKSQDIKSALALIQELATFENEPNAVEVTEDEMIRDGFGENPKFKCFVAESDGNIVGLALVYPRYSTWKGSVVHLEDLIVTKSIRGKGVGKALLDTVVKYASNLGVKRISWEVLDWNEPAIKFYESKGAHIMRDWDVVQLDEKGIKEYLENI